MFAPKVNVYLLLPLRIFLSRRYNPHLPERRFAGRTYPRRLSTEGSSFPPAELNAGNICLRLRTAAKLPTVREGACIKGLLRCTATDHVRPDTVDRRIEVVQADMHTVQCLATDDFACQIEQVVAQDHHMVAVPTNRTAHVQHDLRCKKKQGRNLVGDTFRQMEMARVERHNLILLRTVAQVKIIGTDRITFQTDAEQFLPRYNPSCSYIQLQNLVERLFQYLTIFETAGGNFFTAVVNPQVHNTGIVLVFAHLLADPAAAFRMFDPEIADRIVGIRQRQVAASMRKRSAAGNPASSPPFAHCIQLSK